MDQTTSSGSSPDEVAVNSVSEAFAEMREFLRKNSAMRADDSRQHHFLDRTTGLKYFFESDALVQFFELLDDCRREECILHMLEYVTDRPAGLMIDIDRKQETASSSIFTIDKISHLVALLAETITDALTPEYSTRSSETSAIEELREEFAGSKPVAATSASASMRAATLNYHIFVIKRAQITREPGGDRFKDGIHFLVPDVWLSKGTRKFIVMKFRKKISRAFCGEMEISDAEGMVDMNSPCVSPHLLGSCKIGGVSYALAFAAQVNAFEAKNCVMPLSIDSLKKGLTKPIDEGGVKVNLVYELSLTQYLTHFRGQPTWLRKRVETMPGDREQTVGAALSTVDTEHLAATQMRSFEDQLAQLVGHDSDAAFICDLINALPPSYASEYQLWISVLMVIAQISVMQHHDDYKILAQHFSMRDKSKWNTNTFEGIWSTLIRRQYGQAEKGCLTLRSLEFWVRKENPAAYEEAREKNVHGFLIMRIFESGGILDHTTIAEILFRSLHGLYTVDTDAPTRELCEGWFEFVTPETRAIQPGEIYKWRTLRVAHALHGNIANKIYALCNSIHREIRSRAEHAAEESQKTQFSKIAEILFKSMRQLRQDGFQKSAIQQLRHLLNTRGFVASLDIQKYVIGVGNGVLEFIDSNDRANHAFVPRLIQGYHELRVSSFTDVDYVPYDPENRYVQEILQAYHDIYIEPDACEFMLLYLSTWLDACDAQRKILLLGGGGSNGKTWSVYFPQMTLGTKYVSVFKMQLLTEERERAREANSAYMQLKGARGGYFDEANEGDRLNALQIKNVVTPGVRTGRQLYGNEEQFRVTANTIVISNYEFIVNATDNGTWDRIFYYICKTRFVDNPDPGSPYERKKKAEMTTAWITSTEHRRAMLSILVHYRLRLEREFGGDITKIPSVTIAAETNAFRSRQDPISRFIGDCLVKSPSCPPFEIQALIGGYIEWYQSINHMRPKTIHLGATFQSSIIGEYIRRVDTQTDDAETPRQECMVFGLRLRNKGERLGAGESLFE